MVAVLTAAACTSGPDPVVVLGASSLTAALEDVAAAEGGLAISTAGSQTLAAQLRAGAPGDVVLLADPALAQELADEGVLEPPIELLATGLALVVPVEDPFASDDAPDLRGALAPERLVVLPEVGVPLRTAIDRALALAVADGVLDAADVATLLAGVDSFEDRASTVLQKVALGEADAALVYASDAATAPAGVAVIPLPAALQPRVVYVVQVRPTASAAARALVDGWLDGTADAVWERAGFVRGDD